MWENSSLPSRREFSVRRILTYALAALLAALLWTVLLAPTTFAADATRSGNTFTYETNSFAGPASGKTVADMGLPDGTTVFTFVEPAPTNTTSSTPNQRKIHIIYFAPSVDSSVATSAKYKTYIYQGPNKFISPSTSIDITVTQSPTAANPGTSSCDIGSGIDWLICGPTRWIAKGMDSIFSILSGFLSVRPVGTDQETALFRAWTYMRSFANVAFVIAFLIIIYSQITNVGITNYSLKKLLPRLVIAAILVNVSYYLCAAAVDISNILGYSIQDLFIQLRNGLVGTEGNSWELMNFESIAGFILSGGTAVTAGMIGLIATLSFYGLSGSVFLLLPVLVTGLVAVLTALVVMAGRQAVITILIIIAPIAFVAYLLPNTEKWFDKWRTIFMTMLVLFPAFSVVFGGSQLASAAIIQNADSINQIILAMAIQVIPLLVTPLLIKLSGTILGRVAGMINNPNKGIIDRTRNWSKDKAEDKRADRMQRTDTAGKRNFMLRNGQRLDTKRRQREGKRAANIGSTDAKWANSQEFSDIDQQTREAGESKQLGESRSELRYTQSKLTNGQIRQLDVDVRQVKLDVENAQLDTSIQNWDGNRAEQVVSAKIWQRRLKDDEALLHKDDDADYDDLKGGVVPTSLANLPGIITHTALARDALRRTRIATDRIANAQTVQQQDYVNLLQGDSAIALEAGGIRGEQGQLSVLASAKKAASKFIVDDIQNIQDTMDYDLATNNTELTSMFTAATTLSQRVAYARTMSKNGGPGVAALRSVIKEYEATSPSVPDLMDFKELLGAQPGVMATGKDVEFWLTNSRHDAGTPNAGQTRTFTEISEDNKTWTNMSANAFASQNITTQFYALDRLRTTDAPNYMKVINMLRNSETAVAQLKQGVRESFAIYNDREVESARAQGITLPAPGSRLPPRT